MTFYADLAQTVVQLLSDPDIGQQVLFTQVNAPASAYDPNTGTVGGAGPSAFTVAGVIFDIGRRYGQREIDGTNILATDQVLYLAPQDVNGTVLPLPKPGDTATVAGIVLRVIASRPTNPGGPVVLHELQVRV